MSDLAGRLAGLSPRQRAELESRLWELAPGPPAGEGKPRGRVPRRAGADGRAPLSFSQERMWFLAQLDAGNSLAYHMFVIERLHGRLEPDALGLALREIIGRHESLRTRITVVDGQPVQVADVAVSPLERVDLRAVPAQDREQRARELIDERANTPFDLAVGPLVRCALLRLGEDDHILCLVLHHLIADGGSVKVILRELSLRYAAHTEGRDPAVPPLDLQYADYAQWQRDQAAGPEAAGAMAYWTERLADAPVLDIVTDRPRPAIRTPRGAFVVRRLPAALTAALQRLAREEECTLFMVLLAAYQVLLARYTGQQDICVGSVMAGRDLPELEPLVGLFTDTVVLRGDLSGNPPFRELLARTRATALGAFAHKDIPFERLLTELRLDRDLSRTPIFQTMLILQDPELPALSLPRITTEPWALSYEQAKFDLLADLSQTADGGLSVMINYSTDLFDRATMITLAERFEMVLAAAAADPGTRVRGLWGAMLPAGGPSPGRDLAGTVPSGETVAGMFEAQAARTPTAPAVRHRGWAMSYAELDRRAEALAVVLRRAGAGPEVRVALCVRRSHALIVALLGIAKAGAAYVPLDPGHPRRWLERLVADSGAALLVMSDGLPELSGAGTATITVTDDGAAQPPSGQARDGHDARPAAPALPGNLAYLAYTSGSTGQPKGVAIEHHMLAARAVWMRDAYALRPGDRVLQFASVAFDTHAEEIYPTLLAGAELVLLPESGAFLPEFLASADGRSLTVLDLPASFWQELVTAGGGATATPWPPSLRLVIIGAEAFGSPAVSRWFATMPPSAQLINTYGPTETTIVATAGELGPGDCERRPSAGRPLAGTTVEVLDDLLEPVPAGVPGELYIGGAGLARCYHRQPGLTAAHFLPDPRGGPGARRYRTGDIGRYRPDGSVEILGRTDDQVKVRGHRVELGEVAAHLVAQPQVRQAAVLMRGGKLVAYAAPADGHELTATELRAQLAESLPPAAVPSSFVILTELPVTAGGKVDRRALPDPGTRPSLGTGYLPPATPGEELVAATWADVLGLDRVGALDDFFELGGHSLLATRVVARLSSALAVTVPLRAIFTDRSVRRLTQTIEKLLIEDIDRLTDEEAQQALDGRAEL